MGLVTPPWICDAVFVISISRPSGGEYPVEFQPLAVSPGPFAALSGSRAVLEPHFKILFLLFNSRKVYHWPIFQCCLLSSRKLGDTLCTVSCSGICHPSFETVTPTLLVQHGSTWPAESFNNSASTVQDPLPRNLKFLL